MIICSRTRIFKRWKLQIMATSGPWFIYQHSSGIYFLVICRLNIYFLFAMMSYIYMSSNMNDVGVIPSMCVVTYFEIPEKRNIDANQVSSSPFEKFYTQTMIRIYFQDSYPSSSSYTSLYLLKPATQISNDVLACNVASVLHGMNATFPQDASHSCIMFLELQVFLCLPMTYPLHDTL